MLEHHTHPYDAITPEQLRAAGGLKWSLFPDALGAFVAEADFGTAPAVTAALHEAVARADFGYLAPAHTADLADATARWHDERYGWSVDPARVHPIADVMRGLEIAIEHFSRPGSAVVLPTPAYMPFLEAPGLAGREVVQVPFVEHGGPAPASDRPAFDLDALDAAFAAGAGLLVLVNPHNPTGRVFSREELVAVSEVVERHGGRVFSDEIHAPLVYSEATHVPYASVSEAAAAHTVTATSASKAFNLPGLKCAQFILSNDADARAFRRIERTATHGASTLGVVASIAAYRDGAPWLAGLLDYLDGNRRLVAEHVAQRMPGVGHRPPEGTYFAWLDCRVLDLDHPGAFFRTRAGVALTDGIACGTAGAGHVRLVFATPRPILARALDQLTAALPTP